MRQAGAIGEGPEHAVDGDSGNGGNHICLSEYSSGRGKSQSGPRRYLQRGVTACRTAFAAGGPDRGRDPGPARPRGLRGGGLGGGGAVCVAPGSVLRGTGCRLFGEVLQRDCADPDRRNWC